MLKSKSTTGIFFPKKCNGIRSLSEFKLSKNENTDIRSCLRKLKIPTRSDIFTKNLRKRVFFKCSFSTFLKDNFVVLLILIILFTLLGVLSLFYFIISQEKSR